MIRYGLILLLICFCAALVLSVTYKFTHARIEAQAITEEKSALDDVFLEATDFGEEKLGDETYYVAKKENKTIGYIIRAKQRGYASTITMLVGFDLGGQIVGVKILSQEETPGLGAKINEVRYGENKPWFLKQFEGKIAQELDLKNIQAITGATISSTAVLEGVKKAVSEFLSTVKQ